jgi:hypothetical protein
MIDPRLYDPRPRAIGVSWFRKEDYDTIRRISEDGHKMPSKWEDWLKGAEKSEQECIQTGKIVERVYIDPDTFPDWCRANGVGVNRQGRHKFIAITMATKYRNQG